MKRIVFFDFDGVIVDTLDLSVSIFQKQDPDITADILRSWFEGNVLASVKQHNLSPADFFAEYMKRLPLIPPIQHIPEVLARLAEQYSLVIISSSPSPILKDYLKHYGLQRFFLNVFGSDTAQRKRDNFQRALRELGTSATNCVFVTDTLGDLHEAHAHNMATIAATWGFHSEDVLAQGKPAALAVRPHDLPTLVDSVLAD